MSRLRARLRDERGTVVVLVVGYAVIAALLVTVVVDATTAFQARRSLHSWADGAAVAAAQAVDMTAVYRGGTTTAAPLDEAAARQAVVDYANAARLADRFESFAVAAVDVDPSGTTVRVTLAARAPMPFDTVVSGPGVRITATAQARGPLS